MVDKEQITIELICDLNPELKFEFPISKEEYQEKRSLHNFLNVKIANFLNEKLKDKGIFAYNISLFIKREKDEICSLESKADLLPIYFSVKECEKKDITLTTVSKNSEGKFEKAKRVYQNTTIISELYKNADGSKVDHELYGLFYEGKLLNRNFPIFMYSELVSGRSLSIIEKKIETKGGNFSKLSTSVDRSFSSSAPIYRRWNKGLHYLGKCTTKSCKGFDQEVVCFFKGTENQFKYHDNIRDAICPVCNKDVKAYTLGFSRCEYHIIGRRVDDKTKKPASFDFGKKSTKSGVRIFDITNEKGDLDLTEWISLIVVWENYEDSELDDGVPEVEIEQGKHPEKEKFTVRKFSRNDSLDTDVSMEAVNLKD